MHTTFTINFKTMYTLNAYRFSIFKIHYSCKSTEYIALNYLIYF